MTMKKIIAFLLSIIITVASIKFINGVYQNKIGDKYYDEIGDMYGSVDKNRGIELQRRSFIREDNMQLFGSSDLGTQDVPTHPSTFFKDKKDGFQINLIGRGYSQDIIYAIDFAALSKELKGKKAAIFLSPPWFETAGGIKGTEFGMNFSELQFYSLVFNSSVSKDIKLRIVKRVYELTKDNTDFKQISDFCYFYSKDNLLAKAVYYVLYPYHRFKYLTLSIKDKIITDKILKGYAGKSEYIKPSSNTYDWTAESRNAVEYAKTAANNNDYYVDNKYYDLYLKSQADSMKSNKSYKNYLDLNSKEFDDLKLLLDICKEQGIKPLFINVPLNGKWFDACGSDPGHRKEFYKKLDDMITSYGFEVADFSDHDNDPYFIKDQFHIGWKGWIEINEALDKYFHEK